MARLESSKDVCCFIVLSEDMLKIETMELHLELLRVCLVAS
jgi:hypothetical protein